MGTWNKKELSHCMVLFRQGFTDKDIATKLTSKFSGKWTENSIRSKRGRLERAKKLRRGVAGSSVGGKPMATKKKTKKKTKKIPSEFWTIEAENRLRDLVRQHKAKPKSNAQLARILKREGLRERYNPRAIGDRIYRMKVRPKADGAPPEKETMEAGNTVELRSKMGVVVYAVSNLTFVKIQGLCVHDHFGFPGAGA